MYGADGYENEDERRRRMMAQGGAGGSDPVSSALSQLATQTYQPDAGDADLRKRWQQEEQSTLDRANKGSDYGVAELLRDLAPGLVGVGLDAATNKGRGIGQITAASIAQAQQNIANDRQRMEQAREYALKQRALRERGVGTGFNQAARAAQIANETRRVAQADQNIGLRRQGVEQGAERVAQAGRRVDLAEDQARFLRDPNDPRAMRLKADLVTNGGADPSVLQLPLEALRERRMITDQQVQHYFAPQNAQDAAAKSAAASAASTAARIGAESDLANVSAETAAKQAGATARASTGERIRTEGELADVAATTAGKQAGAQVSARRQAEGANRPPPPGYFVENAAVWNDANQDPAKRNKIDASTLATRVLQESTAGLQKLRAQYGAEPLPSGAKTEAETYKNLAIGQLNSLGHGGVLNEGERLNWDNIVPGLQGSWTDVASFLSGADLSLDQINGLTRAVDTIARTSAQHYGLGLGEASQARPQLPGTGTPVGPPVSSIVGGGSPSGGGGGTVTVRLNGETRPVPAALAKRMKELNPNLEIMP